MLPNTRYGVFTDEASDASTICCAEAVMVLSSSSETPLISMILAPTIGASVAANPLNDCEKFSLKVAVSFGPSNEAYGLAAVSRIVSPQAIMKSAPRKNT
ncbi:hypothetical protein D3C87_1482390 [compost metagenome]